MASISVKETTSVKLDKEAKEEAKKIFKQLGISMGDAFNMFLHQVSLQKGIPFEVKLPNDESAKIIDEARKNINVEPFDLSELSHK